MFDIFIDGKKVGTNLSEDSVLVALNQLINKGSDSFEGITIKKQTRTNESNIELINKWDTVKRVNRIIAEETKNIDENSSFNEVLHAVKVLRTEIGNVIKDLPTIDFEKIERS